MKTPLISCLCVTENRHEFMPWLYWNIDRQLYPEVELVIVDSSENPVQPYSRDNLTVITAPPGTTIAEKRNLAMKACMGEYFAWFDDDDWHAPGSLSWLYLAIKDKPELALVGTCQGARVSLKTGAWQPVKRYRRHQPMVTFTGTLYRTSVCSKVLFNRMRHRSADTFWLRALQEKFGIGEQNVLDEPGLVFWLNHDCNITNPAVRWEKYYTHPYPALVEWTGLDAWGDTGTQLEALRKRVYQ